MVDGSALPLAVAVPIMGAALAMVTRRLPRLGSDILATAVSSGVIAIDVLILRSSMHTGRVVAWMGGWKPVHGFSVGIAFVGDPLAAALALLAAALTTAGILYSWIHLKSADRHLYPLMLLFLAGMQGFALSGDLFDMFVFFEVMGAAAYALTGFKIEDASALQGAVNFGVINSLGAYMSLFGVALLYSRTGQLGLPELRLALAHSRPGALLVAAFVLISCGFLVKAAMAPFHFWLADAHAVAPAPVCVLFSGVMVELGVYGFARVYWQVFSGVLPAGDIRRAFMVAGLLTAVVGSVMCLAQRHLKRLLAYSTIAHVGMFIMAVACLAPDGAAGAAVYIAGHAGVKSALFLVAGYVLNRYGTVDEHELFGRGRDDRLVGVVFVFAGLVLAGLPPFGPGLGKALAEEAVAKAGYPFGPAVFVLVSVMTGAAVLRAGLRIWFGVGPKPAQLRPPESTAGNEEEDSHRLWGHPIPMVVPTLALMAGAVVVGVYPHLAQASAHAAERFVDPGGYSAQALTATAASATHDLPDMGWSPWSGFLAGLSSVLAVLVAIAWIYARSVPEGLRRLVTVIFGPPVGMVRRVHSGHLGDYAAWLVLGLSGLAALIGLPLR